MEILSIAPMYFSLAIFHSSGTECVTFSKCSVNGWTLNEDKGGGWCQFSVDLKLHLSTYLKSMVDSGHPPMDMHDVLSEIRRWCPK